MIMDYHVHTKASPDATGSMKDYIEKAREQKIDEIGFADHVMLRHSDSFQCLSDQLMPGHVQEFLATKEESVINVKLGVEMDFFPDKVEKIKEFVKEYPFDYVLGAVHFIGNWSIDSRRQRQEYERRNLLQAYEDYFHLVQEACACHVFDVLAHPDLIKIFGFKPDCDFSYILNETADVIAKSNTCVEINTAGLRRPCAEIYPSEQFLTMLHDCGVPIVFGSDAHNPEDVGRDFGEAIMLAKRAGYVCACVFDHRQKDFVKI
jgi:histidinol-phosphatase (PHP family)